MGRCDHERRHQTPLTYICILLCRFVNNRFMEFIFRVASKCQKQRSPCGAFDNLEKETDEKMVILKVILRCTDIENR